MDDKMDLLKLGTIHISSSMYPFVHPYIKMNESVNKLLNMNSNPQNVIIYSIKEEAERLKYIRLLGYHEIKVFR